MIERRAIPPEIREEAARWVADRDSGLLNDADELALARWLAADRRHAQAYMRAEQLWAALGEMAETADMRPRRAAFAPLRRAGRRAFRDAPSRGRRRTAWVAAACGLLFLAAMPADLPMRMQADAMTATGERKRVGLPDGSSVRLNTGSALAIDYSDHARRVRLLRGEAEFSVKPDPARPFTVAAAGGSARALGTRFIVREDGDAATVTVTEHRVRVAYRERQRDVGQGERLAFDAANGLGRPHKVEVADAEAWTRGRLIVVDRPLAEVVGELARYHPGHIHVRPGAAGLRVSGNFRTDRPLEALERIRVAVGARATRLTDRLIVLHK